MRNRKNPFGWSYPPGAEHDPRAPWNQKPLYCKQCGEEADVCECVCPRCQNEGEIECYLEPDDCNCGGLHQGGPSKEDYLADKADAIRKYGKEA